MAGATFLSAPALLGPRAGGLPSVSVTSSPARRQHAYVCARPDFCSTCEFKLDNEKKAPRFLD